MNEKWRKLTVKSEPLKINDEIDIQLSGLRFKELGQLAEYQQRKDYSGALNYLLFCSLRKAIPSLEQNSTDGMNDADINELIDNLSAEVATKILEKVHELSGLGTLKNPDDTN